MKNNTLNEEQNSLVKYLMSAFTIYLIARGMKLNPAETVESLEYLVDVIKREKIKFDADKATSLANN